MPRLFSQSSSGKDDGFRNGICDRDRKCDWILRDQNELLLNSSVHQKFDLYLISVNPDDGYRVVVFDIDLLGLMAEFLILCAETQPAPIMCPTNF